MKLEDLDGVEPFDWTQEERAFLEKSVGDASLGEKDRLLALRLAADEAALDDGMAAAVLSALNDPANTAKVRGRAAVTLGLALAIAEMDELSYAGDFEDNGDWNPVSAERLREIEETLQFHYSDPDSPKEVRRKALEGAVRVEKDWHHEAVAMAYSIGDPEWKLTAVFCMQYVEGFEREIEAETRNPDPVIQRHAIEAAGACELEAAWPVIKGILENEPADTDLLIAAIGAAPFTGRDDSLELLEEYTHHDDEDVAETAYESLIFFDGMEGLGFDGSGDEFEGEDPAEE